jgi:hypothetical protein
MCVSFLFRLPIVILVVFLLKLAFLLQVIIPLATVNSATFEVNLKRSLADSCQRCSELDPAWCSTPGVGLSQSTLPLAHAWTIGKHSAKSAELYVADFFGSSIGREVSEVKRVKKAKPTADAKWQSRSGRSALSYRSAEIAENGAPCSCRSRAGQRKTHFDLDVVEGGRARGSFAPVTR